MCEARGKQFTVKTRKINKYLSILLKGAHIAWSKKLVRCFIGQLDRVNADKFIDTRESVQLGLVWQTEAFECWKNSFQEIAILTNQTTRGRKFFCLKLFLNVRTTRHIPSKSSVYQTLATRSTFFKIFRFFRPKICSKQPFVKNANSQAELDKYGSKLPFMS